MSTRDALAGLVRSIRDPVADPQDPNGRDPSLVDSLARPMDRFARAWFGLEVDGIENIPDGPALIVGNHNAGSMFVEALGAAARTYLQRPDVAWYGLAHDAIIGLPLLGRVLHRLGGLQASHDSADAVFAAGGKVLVFPGGNREAYRPFHRRYRVELGERRGFVRLALRHRVPIVPVVFVGGHSGFVVVHDGERLARLLRADRWLRSDTWPLILGLPFGVLLGPGMHLPLPVKCYTRYLPPIDPADFGDPDDPTTVERVYDAVQSALQGAMDELAAQRRTRPWPLRR